MGKPEGQVEDYLIKKCEEYGFLCYKFTSPGRKGVPDRIVIGRGHTVFIELKAENGTPSKLQLLNAQRMIQAGADVRFCFSKSEIDEFFNEALTWRNRKNKSFTPPTKPTKKKGTNE